MAVKNISQSSVIRSIQMLFSAGSATGMTDGQVLEQFLNQHDERAEAAFATLLARHGPLVWSVCRNALSDCHAAEDAFQATFLILVRKAHSIHRRETLGPWLYGVARRVAVRAKAGVARRRLLEEHSADAEATSMPSLTLQEEIDALHEEIDRLPSKYRTAVAAPELASCASPISRRERAVRQVPPRRALG